ncbi:MAG: hypothetical protein A2509_01745 [Candidatus Edwardsbacteria bacterium RIFOXYD12_FULL_50_11]|uniref:Polyketide cyclase n=1 Tax=Candidatus Edwardsbacteria bacterium GWF2_54_11 TaxID=1817851 RepID=A0A1F5RCL0_9BACT|nr:MAG: hypothetical protein A2502_03070 [Candidatus Edwardsbacteria bacterium RifOxyC12_full_54_24]OGF07697.1 MAG: hypothetical protein A2273_04320 [Candidatus Edwardsbacteria bacterium RifOxyA12_full_54_48]OGF09948.1 MAG: hypothetical protein A3K15_10730 [Candidatus Edwardsbacteria bacterium GWE2_54_12]OGF12209.1 MAG: hypothetical protein A2024_04285 [Candidatus Edwardsbacteria bacterium GWF2_54_11]OGF16309.1 MAG: hypothetical protein A2509_01745 [Candidatus Edwardsbacteria bacterium RIFOXYD1
MRILEDIILKDSIEIKAAPEAVFNFLTGITDDKSYQVWHPQDHVAFCWIKGEPWKEGSILRAKEYIKGELHTLTFCVTKVIPNKTIEYVPAFWLLRIYYPKNSFIIEPKRDGCIFTAMGSFRVGRLVKTFAKNKLASGIASVEKHMKEEGENLKRILENENL